MKWIQQHDAELLDVEDLKHYLQKSHKIVSQGLSKKKQRELGLNID